MNKTSCPQILRDIETAAADALHKVRGVLWVSPAKVEDDHIPTYVTITVELDANMGPAVRKWFSDGGGK